MNLTIEHLNMIRIVINNNMDINKMFAVWRVEAPWKPISKKVCTSSFLYLTCTDFLIVLALSQPQGKKMGGGKSPIHHYATPVRAGSVLVEVGGHIELDDCLFFLDSILKRLPCDAMVVSKEIFAKLRAEELEQERTNINPISYERVVKLNMRGCHKWISPYDHRWFGKYV